MTVFSFGCTKFMRSKRMCTNEEPAACPWLFRNIVRISMDLSVISVVLVSSRRTRGLVSRNLITKGVLQLVIVVINLYCGDLANLNSAPFLIQKTGEKAS